MSGSELWDGVRVPMTLLGGYLGAGKTTIVNHLLATTQRRIAVLVNDLGSVAVDAALIAARHDDTIELTNGCICCSLVDGMAVALETVRSRSVPPDHVVIELSGVARPDRVRPFAGTAGFAPDAVVVAADLDQIRERATDPRLADLVAAQLAAADLVVATKTDLVSDADALAARAWLARTADAPVVDAAHGVVDEDVVLGSAGVDRTDGRTNAAARVPVDVAPERGDSVHRARTVRPVAASAEELSLLLEQLPDGIVRAKGVVTLDGGASVLVQVVGRRRRVDTLPPGAAVSDPGVVVIGLDETSVAAACRILGGGVDEAP